MNSDGEEIDDGPIIVTLFETTDFPGLTKENLDSLNFKLIEVRDSFQKLLRK